MLKNNFLKNIFSSLLSENSKQQIEKIILGIAIVSFVVHLALIYLVDFNWIAFDSDRELLKNPIAAIYTPFSFILIYEVYLLIFYLPRSITTYIGKQYEIMTLIVIRRLFKDISAIEPSIRWFEIKENLQFTYDLISAVLLFFLLYLFYLESKKKRQRDSSTQINVALFIKIKQVIAMCLIPLLFTVATFSLFSWAKGSFATPDLGQAFKNINHLFFDQFFSILISVDVILLLVSFFYTDDFHKVIRNSGFIISTILIRMSFAADGLTNTVLIVTAVLFGLTILTIHNKYEKINDWFFLQSLISVLRQQS